MAEVKRLLAASRLVTLTGAGGVGKTRLALQVADQVRRAFDDGVWLVDFGQVHEPELVGHTLVAALGLRDQSGRSPVEMVADHLGAQRLLLVLDCCEHVVCVVAKVVYTLLRQCPHLRVLATSRERLNIYGEAMLSVSPLPVADHDRPEVSRRGRAPAAMTLFANRAALVVPGFGLTDDNWAEVTQICRRLDGLPLAIELAAAQLRTHSVSEILRQLSDRFRLLDGDEDGAPARQRTLRACVEWSYGLCSPLERLLWARAAVFAGSFELDAAEGVCIGADLAAEDLLDLVSFLIDKSILVRIQANNVVRYGMLDTIRDFGREKLRESGDDKALNRRHRDWYEQLAAHAEADLISSRQQVWQARLDREHANLRAALEYSLTEPGEAGAALRMAVALEAYWHRGRIGEGRQWLHRVLARHNGPPTGDLIALLYTNSKFAAAQGDLVTASALADQARTLAERVHTAQARALAAHAAGHVNVYNGYLEQAVAYYEEALALYRAEGNFPWLPRVLIPLAVVYGMRKDIERAIACLEEAVAITESRGEVWLRAYALHHLGLMMWWRGDRRRAVELIEKSLRLQRRVSEPSSTRFCMEFLAWIAMDEQHAGRAATLLGAAEAICRILGFPSTLVSDLRLYHDECEREARRTLGERGYQKAFRYGAGLTIAETIAYALNESPEPEPLPAEAEAILTRRERQVAELVAQGLTNKEIAARLVIGQRTAEFHVERILTKLGFASRTQLVTWFAQQRQR